MNQTHLIYRRNDPEIMLHIQSEVKCPFWYFEKESLKFPCKYTQSQRNINPSDWDVITLFFYWKLTQYIALLRYKHNSSRLMFSLYSLKLVNEKSSYSFLLWKLLCILFFFSVSICLNDFFISFKIWRNYFLL